MPTGEAAGVCKKWACVEAERGVCDVVGVVEEIWGRWQQLPAQCKGAH
jgi:hypothetical protein